MGDAVGIAAAIEHLLDQPTARPALIARAEEFSLDRAADAHLARLLPGAAASA
jgi:hypothetical protein